MEKRCPIVDISERVERFSRLVIREIRACQTANSGVGSSAVCLSHQTDAQTHARSGLDVADRGAANAWTKCPQLAPTLRLRCQTLALPSQKVSPLFARAAALDD